MNFRETGIRKTMTLTWDICAYSGSRHLRTQRTGDIEYSVHKKDPYIKPELTKVSIYQPFSVNIFLTDRALEEESLFKQAMAFFTCPPIYQLMSIANMFHNGVAYERIPFEIDGTRFDCKILCETSAPALWNISLYMANMAPLGEMSGEIYSHITFKSVPPAGHFYLKD